jgi:hypothetical protein
MSVTTVTAKTSPSTTWLRSRGWDLTWLTLSVVLVAGPYLGYLGVLGMQGLLNPVANFFGTSVDSLARNGVNATVALLVGGPHMYATYTRTALDHRFASSHKLMLWSSLLIPMAVVTLALLNLTLLLTLFFFWASVHVLHQILYIVELYNQRRRVHLTRFSRVADYAVVLTALYPLAAWKISRGTFAIGDNNLSDVVAQFVTPGPWMVWLAGGAFAISLAAWLFTSARQFIRGELHVPKTLFIALTVTAAFFVPALGNLDTAFQGMNVWHSLQYLALTWMLNNLRQGRGELDGSPFIKRLSADGSARRYYAFNIALTAGDVALAGLIFAVLHFGFKQPFDYAFDRGYYIAVLSFLLVHYYHDHFLFARPEVIRG